MKKTVLFSVIIFIIITLSLFKVSNINANNSKVNYQNQQHNDTIKTEYKIDNKIVTQEKFEKFLTCLKEISGTWFCAETTTGGITGYDAKDKREKVYEVRYYYDDGKSKNSISSKPFIK
jgi:hypothetical protein